MLNLSKRLSRTIHFRERKNLHPTFNFKIKIRIVGLRYSSKRYLSVEFDNWRREEVERDGASTRSLGIINY